MLGWVTLHPCLCAAKKNNIHPWYGWIVSSIHPFMKASLDSKGRSFWTQMLFLVVWKITPPCHCKQHVSRLIYWNTAVDRDKSILYIYINHRLWEIHCKFGYIFHTFVASGKPQVPTRKHPRNQKPDLPCLKAILSSCPLEIRSYRFVSRIPTSRRRMWMLE